MPPNDAAAVKREIEHLCGLDRASLRVVWRSRFKGEGKVLPRDLLLRMLAWDIQEKAFGGYDKATAKALARYAKGGADKGAAGAKRHLQAGTVLVREYQGTRHTVTVVPDGFVWRDATYTNLSKIARTITGVNWNGPRFFGLRENIKKAGVGGPA